jgi:hypothetical protein
MRPRDLVCDRCWHDFFDTDAFEKCCTSRYPHGGDESRSAKAVASIKELWNVDCNWCEYIRSFIRDSDRPGARVTTSVVTAFIDSFTPKGRNIFHLDIAIENSAGEWSGGAALFLHAWTTSDDIASEHVTARPVRTDVNGEAAKKQLKVWSEECMRHDDCKAARHASFLPTRVIEVSPSGQRNPRLLESSTLHGSYATLSYCWGEKPFNTLTSSNYAKFLKELDPKSLPPTFQDAISTTRDLSISYLWIDALCIIQDYEEDKVKEMAQMKNIYSSSAVTIVAASAGDVHEGFLHPRNHSEPSHTIPVRVRPGVFGTMSVNELDAAGYDERLEPVSRRAWTMQEQLLSQRTLTFTSYTMMWRCCAGTRNFGDSLYFPHDLDQGYNDGDEKYSLNLQSLLLSEREARSHKDKALSCWLRLVTAYSLRSASLECDKLNAVAGIASSPSFSGVLGPQYFAGIWQHNLARQLTWRTSGGYRTYFQKDTSIRRPVQYRAPSWSWASIEGGVVWFNFSFDNEDESAPEVVCEIAACSTAPKSAELNPFGEVLSAHLKLKAAVRQAWFSPPTKSVYLLPALFAGDTTLILNNQAVDTFVEASKRHINDFAARHPDVDISEDPEAVHGTDVRNMCGRHDETEDRDHVVVLCVAITLDRDRNDGVEGLLLRPSEAGGNSNTFRRIGFFERGRNEDFQSGAKMEISII